MFSNVFKTIKKINPVIVISIILFIIPFFWFKPGAMDLGGDGNRLYFYDPIGFIKNVSLYAIDSEGKGNIEQRHAYLIYVSFIALIKHVIDSPSLLMNVFSGIKLSVGFLSIYFIVKEFIRGSEHSEKRISSVESSAIVAGIFYVLLTGYEKLIFYWSKALHSHDQIFLNPLMFFLLLRYLLTQNRWYLWSFLLTSFLFSTSFAMISSPPFFAFYPIALFFLFSYVVFIRKVRISTKEIIIGFTVFLGLQSFHLIPEIANLMDPGSGSNTIVFKDPINAGLNYFLAVIGLGKASFSLFVPTSVESLRWTSFIAPLVIMLGYLLQRKKHKEILLTSLFFLITFFLVTANITHIGVQMYSKLFYIPGFSMFRNFYSQWAYVFIFFYTLLFGLSLSVVFTRLKRSQITVCSFGIILVLIIGFWAFLSGQLVDVVQWGSKGVKTAMIIDPRYEETLGFIKKLPDEGKILMLPLTDNYIQVIYGTNNAAYVGPSSISILTHKKSFAGYQNFWPNPIPETIMRFAREKNYEALTQIFSLFNIRYIFHNTDPKIYEEKFPNFPNSYMMTSLPKTQEEYKEFVKKFPARIIYENGPFEIFELDKAVYRPEIYIPDSIYKDDVIRAVDSKKVSYRAAFIDKSDCQKSLVVTDFCNTTYKTLNSQVNVKKISPVRYNIDIKLSESNSPFLLIFQNSYHKDWKLSVDGNKPLSEESHVLVNKYANAWVLTEKDHKGKTEFTLTLNLETQRYFWYGLWVTGATLLLFVGFVIRSIVTKKM